MIRIRSLRTALAGATIALLLSACATTSTGPAPVTSRPVERPAETPALTPQMSAAADTLTKIADMQARLYKAAAPLLIRNADLCKAQGQGRNLLGFTAKNRWSYPGEYNEAAHVAFNMGERLQVTDVLAGSGAAKAGLQSGDVLVAASGKPVPAGQNALANLAPIFGKVAASLPLTIERHGSERQLTIPVTSACAYAIEVGNADNVNAYGDGSRVLVTRGMIGLAKDDDDLALVLATTMAHNLLGHAAAQRNQATIGSIIDNLKSITPDTSLLIGSGGIKAMPADMDAAAARLGVYLAARAGYDVDDAAAFWKRLDARVPATVLNGYNANHPSLPARLAATEKAVAEVKAKRAAKKPLTP